ncbi:MAG: Nucleotidyltransferase domain protein [Promethearchaeota archaeon]|nr:MAG: Nucleotidyltransferase domain protein [Candidatus Lokiarchaeota archaeon]
MEDFLEKIDKKDLKLIMLFGSLAKGTFTQHSDIDLLCVYEKEFTDQRERFMHTYQFSKGIVQPKTISWSELKENLLNDNSFMHHIFKEGIKLYNKIPENKLNS